MVNCCGVASRTDPASPFRSTDIGTELGCDRLALRLLPKIAASVPGASPRSPEARLTTDAMTGVCAAAGFGGRVAITHKATTVAASPRQRVELVLIVGSNPSCIN